MAGALRCARRGPGGLGGGAGGHRRAGDCGSECGQQSWGLAPAFVHCMPCLPVRLTPLTRPSPHTRTHARRYLLISVSNGCEPVNKLW